jgi:putative addiction module CopG family antidote
MQPGMEAVPPSISLSGDDRRIIEAQLEAGHFASAPEVVGEALRMLRDRELLLGRYRDAIRDMVEQGSRSADRGEIVSGEAVMAELRRRSAEAKAGAKKTA